MAAKAIVVNLKDGKGASARMAIDADSIKWRSEAIIRETRNGAASNPCLLYGVADVTVNGSPVHIAVTVTASHEVATKLGVTFKREDTARKNGKVTSRRMAFADVAFAD